MSTKGHKHSPETRAKMSASHRGHGVSPETCAKLSAAGRGNHNRWKNGRWINGYVYVHSPDHPFATNHGYVREHRLVMEGLLGRYLTRGEQVHHLNGIKDDNRPENLAVLVVSGTHSGWVLCPHCQKSFLIR